MNIIGVSLNDKDDVKMKLRAYKRNRGNKLD